MNYLIESLRRAATREVSILTRRQTERGILMAAAAEELERQERRILALEEYVRTLEAMGDAAEGSE